MSLGLPLPNWCSEKDFIKLGELAVINHESMISTQLMTRITVGPMVERFLKNIDNSELQTNKRKIYVYSAHDINIAMFSNSHKFTGIPRVPDYGSALIIEKLRGQDGQIYLRVSISFRNHNWTHKNFYRFMEIWLTLFKCLHRCFYGQELISDWFQ